MKSCPLNPDDVVSVEKGKELSKNTFTVTEMLEELYEDYLCRFDDAVGPLWIKEGASCKVLSPNGSGWVKGKIRFSLEFIPDTPSAKSSSLDDLRQKQQAFE